MPLYLLENTIQKYDWGDENAISEFIGVPNQRQETWAELWMGAHPKAPSLAHTVDQKARWTLAELITQDPATMIGAETARRFDGKLPFLFKILSAAKPLSIQAHPTKRKAEQGYAREERSCIPINAPERNYKDPNHKPETVIALGSTFDGLCGFRPIDEILDNVRAVGYDDWRNFAGRLELSKTKLELSLLFYYFLTLKEPQKSSALGYVKAACRSTKLKDMPPRQREAYEWTARLLESNPGDIGALGPLVFNVFKLDPGQALNLEAGQAHGYLHGMALEIMANSDNVIRGGLTHKHMDVTELMSVLSFDIRPVTPLSPSPDGTGFELYPTNVPDYSIARASVTEELTLSARPDVPEILLCTEGALRVQAGDETPVELSRGSSVFVPAAVKAYRVSGSGQLFRASVPA